MKGIKFCPEKNVFKARIVYFEAKPDKADDMMQCEEEIFVEEKWVRDEFSEEDVQHIMNMRQSGGWNQVPRDLEI